MPFLMGKIKIRTLMLILLIHLHYVFLCYFLYEVVEGQTLNLNTSTLEVGGYQSHSL